MTIDAHQHFWMYRPADFDWIGEGMAAIRRDFLPADLCAEMQACGVEATVAVQARQSLEETDGLLRLAAENDFIAGVVGWLPLADPTIENVLARYAGYPKLKGVRHVVQGQPAGFLDHPAFNRGIRALRPFGLAYDLLVFENQLEEATRFVDRHPDQVFVLDHAAKPAIRDGRIQPWRERLHELARREHVCCKISGLVTEALPRDASPRELQPYFDAILEAFGPERLMFGSDWPVCLLAASYRTWFDTLHLFIEPLSPTERAAIMGRTACAAYTLQLDAHT